VELLMIARDGRPRLGLGLVLVATLFTLLLGFAHKSICLMGEGFDANAYRLECYNDIVPLYRDEGLLRGDVPYLEAPNEYPVATGLFMWGASQFGRGEGDFFVANAVLLAGLGILTSWLLYLAVGGRAMYFALAPSLALYAFLNWDLLAVTLATAATVAFLRRRDAGAGVLIGLGIASKLYPVLLLLPFVLERWREGGRSGTRRLLVWAAVTWTAINLPFMLFSFERWAEVFRLNSSRPVDWGTVWYAACRTITGRVECGHVRLVNVVSVVLFTALAIWIWRVKTSREPEVPRWTLAFPLLIVFLLTTKVYSPQYSLWLIPWFALVLPDVRFFLAFEAADVAVFVTEFSWLGRHLEGEGLPVWPLQVAVIARAAILVGVLAAYVRRPTAVQAASRSAGAEPSRATMTPSWSE
jgi:uncharacterized membrane protein